MKFINKSFLLTLLFAISLTLGGCNFFNNLFGSSDDEELERDDNPFTQNIDIDPRTGVQYYLPEEYVQLHELPDGSFMPMVLIPGGSFLMGNDNTDPLGIQPAGKVRVSVNSFMMGQFEVTNGQYKAFLNSIAEDERQIMMPDSAAWEREIGVPWRSYFHSPEFNDFPVVAVTWDQAVAFAEWAGLRLPAESEWEYAARSGVSGRVFPWDGLDIRSRHTGQILANFAPGGDFAQDGFVITAPVGVFPPNNFRLFDMAGNVAEWCQDAYFPSYTTLTRTNTQLVTPLYENENEPRRIVRGGSWASNEFFIGVGVRDFRHRNHASPRVGFRVSQSVTDPNILLNQSQRLPGVNMINTRIDRQMGTQDTGEDRGLFRPMQTPPQPQPAVQPPMPPAETQPMPPPADPDPTPPADPQPVEPVEPEEPEEEEEEDP
ncbi:MAG: formylglycine-generating enzyme family protein [Balneolales bacterium]|nr:formylglycine-generating enzyme family protein [Balneolales bacterium]